MMKRRGKEEDDGKIAAGPLFPRLHVNDAGADRGGPRAPPRNKMALYEQLATPSQRVNPALPLPSYNAGAVFSLPSASPSQGGDHERSLFSPFYVNQSPAQSVDLLQSRTYSANNIQSIGTELTRKPVGHANQKSTSAASVVQVRSFLPRKFSTGKSCEEKLDDGDDFRVPSFLHSDTNHSNKDICVIETKKSTPLHANIPQKNYSCTLNSSTQFPSSYDKPLEETGADPKSRKHERDHNEHRHEETLLMKPHKEKSVSHLEAGEEVAVNSSKAFSDQEQTSTRNFIEKPPQRNIMASLGSCANGVINEPGSWSARNDAENHDSLLVRNELYTKDSFGTSHRSLNRPDKCNHGSDDQVSESVEPKDADKNDEVCETLVAESLPGMEISPDDVVGEIGQKQFWKARQAIVNQQRVFSIQVFELHRLIKVQKLIAASPNLLLEENPNRSGSPQKVTSKNLPPEPIVEAQQQTAKQKDELQKLRETECQIDNTIIPPLPPRDDGLNNGLRQLPKCGPYSGDLLPVLVAPDRQTSWCYPPGNHWLVPVMSPSEGLIYKPYSGPCPPAAGFMAPAYGNCGPLSLPPVAGHFMNATYGSPPSHQQQTMTVLSGTPEIAPNHFPNPYGHPLADPNISAMAAESPIPGTRHTMQFEQWSKSSCNMAIPRSEAFSGCPPKVPASKESELQGSTTTSPSEKAQKEGRDAFHIPTAPCMNSSSTPLQLHGGHRHTRVIKVVPHNARSASESVARIFQSIQEERQQSES